MISSVLALSALVVSALSACPKLPAVAGVAQMQKSYPALGQIAKIMPGDDEASPTPPYASLTSQATKLFAAMNANKTYADALALAPKKLKAGNPDFSQREPNSCWWSDDGCVTSKRAYIPPDYTTCPCVSPPGLALIRQRARRVRPLGR